MLLLGIEATGCECSTSLYGMSASLTLRQAVDMVLWVLHRTQLAFGSRNLHHTPSSLTPFIFRHRLRKTLSILFLKSIMPISSFALVGLAA